MQRYYKDNKERFYKQTHSFNIMSYKRFFKIISQEVIRDFTSFGNPIILIIISAIFLGITVKLLYIILGLLLVELFCWIIKFFYYKKRPKEEVHANIPERMNAGSFPSLHSARSSFIFTSLFLLSNSIGLRILFIILIIIVGLTRISLKKHYLSDIIAGYFIGIIFSLIENYLNFF